MREITRSMLSLSWAMPLFALRQATQLVDPREWSGTGKTTRAFDTVAQAAQQELDGLFRETYQFGDDLQRRVIDLVCGGRGSVDEKPPAATSPRSAGGGVLRSPLRSPASRDAASATRVGARGWGLVPPGSY